MTRLPDAVWRPGPAWKRGYGGVKWNSLNWKEGEVKHSSEGPLSATFGVLDSDTGGSWHFTLPKHGPVRYYQHYELEDICWHCGLPGDLSHDTSLIGNITLIGEEHEGLYNEPWTAWQLHNSVRLSVAVRAHCIGMRLRALAWRGSLWRHRFLSLTACDSFRAPEDLPLQIAAAETPPIVEEEEETVKLVKAPSGAIYILGEMGKYHLKSSLAVSAYVAAGYTIGAVTQAQLDDVEDTTNLRIMANWLMDKDENNLAAPNRLTSWHHKLEALTDAIRDDTGVPVTVKELVAEALEEQT